MEALFSEDIKSIKQSLSEMNKEFNDTLILNPVENIPIGDILEPCSSFLHGLYNTDTLRNLEEKYKSKIQFSGRDRINKDVNMIYDMWGNQTRHTHAANHGSAALNTRGYPQSL